jgi:putative DNA recombinase|uniref:Integrase n=1 Tax=Siphoviridae sp. ctFiA6 TaxID=2823573 RepID=A0A8S5LGH4_9CAUD|nr:MAG TPA: integrase [Siphoviridae sp. ctFiA6]
MNKKVAIYVRVSSLDQAKDGYSLAAQERTLRKYCLDKNYSVYELYADEGISGKDMVHRPAVQRLMQDAEEKKFDVILFWALSRFTRSVSDLYQTVYKLNQLNIDLVSYTEAFDTSTPFGRAAIGILGVFAQLERELTSERVSFALNEKFEQNKYTPSYMKGYIKKNGKLHIIKKKKPNVLNCASILT